MNRSGMRIGLGLLLGACFCWTATVASADTCSASTGKKDIVDTAVAAGSFKTLATALTKADLVAALKGDGPFTVFAPSDEAFAKLSRKTLNNLLKPENKGKLAAILTYHVVSGRVPAEQAVKLSNARTLNGQQLDLRTKSGKLTVSGANVVQTDIECSNGVIHVIDSVMLPSDKDIVESAQSAGMFKTLLAAASAAELAPALKGKGPFTVFAPTDEAFAKLPDGTMRSLLKPENRGRLVEILKYHVASGRAFATDALAADEIATLQGDGVRVRISDGRLRVNDAAIIKTDVNATNGVIHVIDSVLIPESGKRASAGGPRDLIELAIRRGVPLFNNGDIEACTAVYEITANGLLGMKIPNAARTRLIDALADMRSTHDARRQAWILRHALDAAYSAM